MFKWYLIKLVFVSMCRLHLQNFKFHEVRYNQFILTFIFYMHYKRSVYTFVILIGINVDSKVT